MAINLAKCRQLHFNHCRDASKCCLMYIFVNLTPRYYQTAVTRLDARERRDPCDVRKMTSQSTRKITLSTKTHSFTTDEKDGTALTENVGLLLWRQSSDRETMPHYFLAWIQRCIRVQSTFVLENNQHASASCVR